MHKVLVIDDHSAIGTALKALFSLHGIHTEWVASPRMGLDMLTRGRFDLVIADMNFAADTTSGEEGIALFRALRGQVPDMPVLLMTAWARVESAVKLVKEGAVDYIEKPWDNAKLIASVKGLLDSMEETRRKERFRRVSTDRRQWLYEHHDLTGIVFESGAMTAVVELTCKVAPGSVPVVITGSNGVGKEQIAVILHANSSVRNGPFVAVNCGALPENLLEAELFGAEAGAFTGANRARIGRFECANGGTLFLDEIGNLSLAGQAKFLRVLETGKFEPLGSNRSKSVSVRVVSATSADLQTMILEGRFREDLFYRLNVVEITIPPLVDRKDDILPLARHFLGKDLQLTPGAEAALLGHHWPGNVRELRNCIARAKLLAQTNMVYKTELGLPELVLPRMVASDTGELTREELETWLLSARGNVSQAAQRLGMSRQALYRRMEQLGIRRQNF